MFIIDRPKFIPEKDYSIAIKKIVNKLNPDTLIVIVAPLFKIPKVIEIKIKAKIKISGAKE